MNVASATSEIDNNAWALPDGASQNIIAVTDQNVLTDPSPSGTFNDLQDEINSAITRGDSKLILSCNYTFDESSDNDYKLNGIQITQPLSIEGNGNTIDAMHLSRIFAVHSDNIVFNNITFVNFNLTGKLGERNYTDCGGAICSWNMHDGLNVTNCIFKDGTTVGYGGAVFSRSNNTNIENCYFENCKADQRAAAICFYQYNCSVFNCDFIGNEARYGGAIFTGSSPVNISISKSRFIGNKANRGGAVYLLSSNATVEYCNFTSNEAYSVSETDGTGKTNVINAEGAGLYVRGNNTLVNGCNFTKNIDDSMGAGLYIASDDVNVTNSTFEYNDASNSGYGGAIHTSTEANNTQISYCNFTKNHASVGGAVSLEGANPTLSYLNFIENNGNTNGGSLYVDLAFLEDGIISNEAHILHSNFTNNSAYRGGAIQLRDEHSHKYWVYIDDCNFINNTVKTSSGNNIEQNIGGAVNVNGLANITNSYFEGNIAGKGSAIYVAAKSGNNRLYNTLSVDNVTFVNNRANANSLDIKITENESYYPSNVTIDIIFKGFDNIANAIWNDKSVNDVFIKNITYEAFINEKLFTLTTDLSEYVHPVLGAENSNNGEKIWQDNREDAQLLNVKIINTDNQTNILDQIGNITDIYGNVTKIMKHLKPGNYSVYAEHISDVYYTKATATNTFVIYDVDLKVNKTADVAVVGNNSIVNFTIEVKNFGPLPVHNVTLTDLQSETKGLTLLSDFGFIDDINVDKAINLLDGNIKAIISTLEPNQSVRLWVCALTNQVGNATNMVFAHCDENKTDTNASCNVTVVPVVLNINKAADVAVVANGSVVNYTIVVSNVGKVNATNVSVVDAVLDGLTFDKAGVVDANGANVESDISKPSWVIDKLVAGESVKLWITATVNGLVMGNVTNTVSVTSKENKTSVTNETNVTVVPVVLNINKTVDVSPVGNNTLVNFTITVSNADLGNATDVIVIDELLAGLTFVGAGVVKDQNVHVEYLGQFNNGAKWNISKFNSGDVVELWITACTNVSEAKTLTNNVNVTSKQNNTVVQNSTDVEIVPVILTVKKSANVTKMANNTLVSYKITVNNTSIINATNVTVIDSLPEGLEYVVATHDGAEFSISDDKKILTWKIAKMTNKPVEFVVTVRTSIAGNLTNNVTVNCNENKTNVTANETVEVVPVILTVNKTANATVVENDTYVTFKIVVNNTSEVNATYVVVIDNLPEGLEYVDSTTRIKGMEYSFKPSKDEKTFTWTLPEFYESIELFITVKTTHYGNFTNNVTVTSKENNTSVKDNETIKVIAPSLVNGENVTYPYGEPIKVDFNTTNATGVVYEIRDVNGTIVDSGVSGPNGTIDVKELSVGNYTVYWNNTVDSNHIQANNVSTIEILPAPSLVNGTDVTVTYGEPIVVPYDSTNATSVTYVIYDDDTPVANGTVGPDGTVPVDQLPVGNYTVNWTNIVDGNHIPATNTSTITVNPAPSTVEGENVTVYYGDPIAVSYESTNATNVTYEIFDSEGKSILNGTVGSDGTVLVDQLPVGNYTVNWTTIVDNNHIPATNTSTIEVLLIPTQVTIGNVTAYPGENVTIPINVTTIDGVPFNGTVAVVMPDNSTQIVSVTNGTGVITWYVPEDYTPDKYPDVIRFPGSDVYEPSNGTGIIEVVKIPTHISVGNVTTFAGMEVSIPINVTADDGKPFNGNVTITFPDGSTKTVEIINGTGTTTWFVPYDYTPDKYPDNVKFAGNNKYLPSEGNGTITVVKIPVDIIVGDVTAHPGEEVTIPIKVIPRDGSVFNGKVTVELPDGTIKVVDIINGKGSVKWTVPKDYKEGVYPVKVYSNETNIYYAANGTGTVTVIVDELIPPVDNGNKTQNNAPSKNDIAKGNLAKYETGNPIFALLVVLALLGVGIKRRR